MISTPVRFIIIAGVAALCCTIPAIAQDNAPSTSPTTPSTSGQTGSQTTGSTNTQSGSSDMRPGSSNMQSGASNMQSGASNMQSGASTTQSGSAMGNSSSTAAQDKTFLMNSAEGSMAEIQMSQLALKKSKNDEIKTFAQKMVDDHTKLIADMKPFADQMGVVPPSKLKPAHQQEAQRLRSMSGDKFDKEYITAMVADHHKDLGEFKTEASTTANPDLKTTVSQGEQVIQQHTEMIDALAQKNGVTAPPMPAM